MEWFNNLIGAVETDITSLFDGINQIVNNTNELLNNLNSYIQLSTAYIYISGIILFVLFIMMLTCISKLKNNKEMNVEILTKLDYNDFSMDYDVTCMADDEKKELKDILRQCRSENESIRLKAIERLEEIKGEFGDEYNDECGDQCDYGSR